MTADYGTARWLRTDYDPKTRSLTITLCDLKGDWNYIPTEGERLRIVPADAIVIDRVDLPEVKAIRPGTWEFDTGAFLDTWDDKTSEDARREALEMLALAEYLDAHPPTPPVGDEDLETLTGILERYRGVDAPSSAIARLLLATGRVSVTR